MMHELRSEPDKAGRGSCHPTLRRMREGLGTQQIEDGPDLEDWLLARLRLPTIQMVIFAAVASHTESIRGSDPAVPMSRVLYRAFLVSEVCVDQSISLRVALCPLEVVE